MTKILWIPTFLLLIQVVHSYILLTANIDDIRNIGKRVASSPIVGQAAGMVRRAYDAFNTHLNKARAQMRADKRDFVFSYHPSDPSDNWRKNSNSRRSENDQQNDKEQANKDQNNKDQANSKELSYSIDKANSRDQANNKETKYETFSSLGKSASVYLEKIKNIFEKANPGKTWNEQIAEE